jgi:hypothetical protein
MKIKLKQWLNLIQNKTGKKPPTEQEFGTDVIGLFNDQLHDQTKQFVVAALVSVREIETTDLSIITANSQYENKA